MRKITRILTLTLLFTLCLDARAKAQSVNVKIVPSTNFVSCDQTPPVEGAYIHCALWLEHDRLRQGMTGKVLALGTFTRPVHLTDYVRGDSAIIQAWRFEHDRHVGAFLASTAVAMLGYSFVIANRNHCYDLFCSRDDAKFKNRVFLFGSGAVGLVATEYLIHSARSAARALWWHNSTLGR